MKKLITAGASCLALSLTLLVSIGCASPEPGLAASSDPAAMTADPVQEPGTQESDQAQEKIDPALLAPAKANKKAPDQFKVEFTTTQGKIVIEVTREWAPNGADRFYNMVDVGYFNDIVIFRAIEGFMFQFGVHGNPKVAQAWKDANIQDDKFNNHSNLPYTISFAQTGRPNSRSSQMFINLGNNSFLDNQAVPFVPFGKVVEGKDVVDKINTEYGENERMDQGMFVNGGNEYILKKYPKLDIIKSAKILE